MFFQTAAIAVVLALSPVQIEQLVGTWQGTLTEPDNSLQPVGITVFEGADGKITAVTEGPAQQGTMPAVRNLALVDGVVTFEIEGIAGRAKLRLAGDTMTGVWESPQGELPLSLTRNPGA